MSDTPRTDAAAQTCMDTTSEWHGEWVPLKLAQKLERELAEAQHRIRTLIEQRDGFRIQADHKWRLREEFEAVLGTSDIETGVERVKEAQKGAARYECVRSMNAHDVAELFRYCAFTGMPLDTEVDRRRNQK